jgi:hypothetical protein
MALYAFHNLILEVKQEGQESGEDLPRLLEELLWVKISHRGKEPSLRFSISVHSNGLRAPPGAHEVFRADGFSALVSGEDCYLTDGSSLMHLQPWQGQGAAFIAPSFFTKRPLLQSNFWAFSLLKLLRPLGIYSLHAAGLATRDGSGVLLVGASGSGKSTLAIGLIREGWHYLSDDAVLLSYESQAVHAMALRRNFYIDAVRSSDYSDLPLGEDAPDSNGGKRRRIGIHEAFTEQYMSRCLPHILIFPRIKRQQQSALKPVHSVSALQILLAQSAPQLFDRSTMSGHLEVLKRLLQQTEVYELHAGTDLYREPAKLVDLLEQAREKDATYCH